MTKTDLPKAINLRELDTETAVAILEIQTCFSDNAASKAVVRAVTRYMPLNKDNQRNQQIIREKDNLIREEQSNHTKELEAKVQEIESLKNTLAAYLNLKNSLNQFEGKLKELLK